MKKEEPSNALETSAQHEVRRPMKIIIRKENEECLPQNESVVLQNPSYRHISSLLKLGS